jgi:hypothetical protein
MSLAGTFLISKVKDLIGTFLPDKIFQRVLGSLGHLHTGFRTHATRLSTHAAMFHSHLCMLVAFFCTGIANIGADTANLHTEFAAQAHYFRRGTADGRAFQVQLDTTGKHFNILLH